MSLLNLGIKPHRKIKKKNRNNPSHQNNWLLCGCQNISHRENK